MSQSDVHSTSEIMSPSCAATACAEYVLDDESFQRAVVVDVIHEVDDILIDMADLYARLVIVLQNLQKKCGCQ